MHAKREKWANNFSEWFNEVIETAGILDVRYPVKGLYVWLPYGFKIRRLVTELIREILYRYDHEEVLFPILIPETEFAKEAQHIKGFEDQVYWVTHGGLDELNVKLVLRPTSETAFYPMFALWIRSHADMPLKIFQIGSVFRYETKHTRPLIRLREITTFKEAHTAHASYEDAERQVKEAIAIYKEFFDRLAIPYSICRRPDWDKFPGAEYTVAFDTIFPDGRTLQIATVHNLAQNFSKTFEITFENIKGEQEYAYQTCYGISDRVIASLIALHGDDRGLILVPEVSPIQVVIVPIWYKDKKEEITDRCFEIKEKLEKIGIRAHVDNREKIRPGAKFYEWELKGIPVRIEIGPKDFEENTITVCRRDTLEKIRINADGLEKIKDIFAEIYKNLKNRAYEEFNKRISFVDDIEEAKKCIKEKKVVRAFWCGEEECGKEIEDKVEASLLGILLEGSRSAEGMKCVNCKKEAKYEIQIARMY